MTRRRNQFARVLSETSAAHRAFGSGQTVAAHRSRREGDEMACQCGKRWPAGENHP